MAENMNISKDSVSWKGRSRGILDGHQGVNTGKGCSVGLRCGALTDVKNRHHQRSEQKEEEHLCAEPHFKGQESHS